MTKKQKRMIELAKLIQQMSYLDPKLYPPEWMQKMRLFVDRVKELTDLILLEE
jgi:hypothetical protein